MISENDILPNITFKTRVRVDNQSENPFDWKDITTNDYFKDKKCILFALPGAFTPTCSSSHLPGYKKMYQEFIDLGIDEIYCLSVNDAFVMRKWGIDQGLEEDKQPGSLGFKTIKLIPDGTAEFTRSIGMNCFGLCIETVGPEEFQFHKKSIRQLSTPLLGLEDGSGMNSKHVFCS